MSSFNCNQFYFFKKLKINLIIKFQFLIYFRLVRTINIDEVGVGEEVEGKGKGKEGTLNSQYAIIFCVFWDIAIIQKKATDWVTDSMLNYV